MGDEMRMTTVVATRFRPVAQNWKDPMCQRCHLFRLRHSIPDCAGHTRFRFHVVRSAGGPGWAPGGEGRAGSAVGLCLANLRDEALTRSKRSEATKHDHS